MIDLYSIIVVYNKELDLSPTYNLCKDIQNLTTIVCDNSIKPNHNESTAKKDGVVYISMNGNKGISRAYNAALDMIKEKKGYVILMDDDTKIDKSYFEMFLQNEAGKSDIYLPIVKDEKGIMSPAVCKNGIISRSNTLDIAYSDITGINSGMIIDLDCFKDFRYEESLFLDYVDHYFLLQMKQRNKSIKVFPYEIYQNFSANTNNKNASLERWKIFKRDSQYFYNNNKMNGFYVLLKRRIHLMLQYKDITFLWR